MFGAWLYNYVHYLISEGCNTTVETRSHTILSSPGGRSLSNLCVQNQMSIDHTPLGRTNPAPPKGINKIYSIEYTDNEITYERLKHQYRVVEHVQFNKVNC